MHHLPQQLIHDSLLELSTLRNDLRNLRHRVGPDPDVVTPPPVVAGAGSSAPWLPAGAVAQALPAGNGREEPAPNQAAERANGAERPARADDV